MQTLSLGRRNLAHHCLAPSFCAEFCIEKSSAGLATRFPIKLRQFFKVFLDKAEFWKYTSQLQRFVPGPVQAMQQAGWYPSPEVLEVGDFEVQLSTFSKGLGPFLRVGKALHKKEEDDGDEEYEDDE